MNNVLSTIITEEREFCHLLISLFSEACPSQFRWLSELKFLSPRDDQMDSESTNVGFVSLCTLLPHWDMCRTTDLQRSHQDHWILLLGFFSSCSSWSLPRLRIYFNSLVAWLLMSSSSFFSVSFFSNLTMPADINTVNCHLPVLMSAGYVYFIEKYQNWNELYKAASVSFPC